MSKQNICAGFRAIEIWPLHEYAMDDQLGSSENFTTLSEAIQHVVDIAKPWTMTTTI